MKRILYYIAICLATVTASSCSKFDNYDAPAETIRGTITDVGTGKPVQSEVTGDASTGNGTRIKLVEISWSPTATPLYLGTMQDGIYNNTKVFAATYKMAAEGAFVPLIQTNPAVDNSKVVEVKGGTTVVDFAVEPFLRIEWVGDPVLNADGTITSSFKITRGTANPSFQQNITDVALFVSPVPYVGNNNYDNRYSPKRTFSGNAANALLGTTMTLTTTGTLAKSREYYLRVGSRIAYGTNIYNYNETKMVTIP